MVAAKSVTYSPFNMSQKDIIAFGGFFGFFLGGGGWHSFGAVLFQGMSVIHLILSFSLHLFSTGHRVKYVTLADSYKLCYCERGQPSSSPKEPTLVLLHGYSGSKSTWTGTINVRPMDTRGRKKPRG